MVAAANMVEIAALVGDTARATILAALMSGQALAARARRARAGVTGDRQRTSEQAYEGATADRHAETTQSLLPDRVTAGCEDAGKHQGGGRIGDAAALSAAFGAGRRVAFRLHAPATTISPVVSASPSLMRWCEKDTSS